MDASPTPATVLRLFSAQAAVLDAELEDWGARSGADSGHPQMSGRILFGSSDDAVEVGVWACTAGGWAIIDRADTETVQILAGLARLTDADGVFVDLGPGDVLVLPKGWSGRWDILEPVRKLYVLSR